MMRLISILLVLAGLFAAGLGVAALLPAQAPAPAAFETPPPPPPPAAIEAPVDDPALDIAAAPPPAPAEAEAGDMAPASAGEAPEAVMTDEDFNFQPMLEPAPPPSVTARSASAPEAAAPSEAPRPASRSFVDSLTTVPIAHETPRSAEYKRAFDVTFAINATGSGTDATSALPGRGVIETGEARVSERVEVRLSGAAFSITPTSPPVQLLSPVTDNTWRWSVMPLTAGDHELVFEIFAIDTDNVVPLRTFRDTVTVRVSGLNHAIAFADQANPLFVLLGGLGSLLAGIFGVVRFFSKK
ncbi:hypothetical protein [Hyphomonas sp.]|uniref:hypothetical protein n=1 Tax=Hyphomonas sp. TaxID=87 RepID=UPI0039191A84